MSFFAHSLSRDENAWDGQFRAACCFKPASEYTPFFTQISLQLLLLPLNLLLPNNLTLPNILLLPAQFLTSAESFTSAFYPIFKKWFLFLQKPSSKINSLSCIFSILAKAAFSYPLRFSAVLLGLILAISRASLSLSRLHSLKCWVILKYQTCGKAF